ncbi:hypothetical protein L5515_000523 [Caenorhabditis briggsae]|uniref:RRM domain-containing protein n=1 Tax=Caenorhabditis briggsae TaxID=6238 RepID=A0AAE9E2P3_CAEBR|nr:hypothetical protein L5515_000523 [Caenorhabditis briggsae]
MIPTSQQEKMRRNLPMKFSNMRQNSPDHDFKPFFDEYFYPHSRNVCPKHASMHRPQEYGDLNFAQATPFQNELSESTGLQNFGHGRAFVPGIPGFSSSEFSSLDMAKLQLQYLMMINSQASNGLDSMISPPSTISSPLNTSHPFNTIAQSLTNGNYAEHCDAPEPNYSPSPTDDFKGLGSNFNFNVSSRINSANGYYKNDGYERGAMYTAEDVHVVVKNHRDGNKQRVVSNKVFVGGISHSMNRETINTFFGKFGTVFVDWPVKQKCNARGKPVPMTSYSYLFLVYSEEQSVIKLMKECQQSGNDFFVVVPGCQEAIQIRPWFIKNAFYISNKARNSPCINIHRTVFVGGLPRIVTAEEIAQIFSEFGKVLLVTIDIDQDYAYPKGAARVTFERDSSFSRALERKYLKFKNIDSSKTLIEIKPYVMEDVGCDQCGGLWFNPFLDVYDQLKSCKSKQNQQDDTSINSCASKKKTVDSESQFLDPEDLFSKIDAGYQRSLNSSKNSTSQDVLHDFGSENEVETGARKFLAMTKSFGLDQEQTVNVLGKEYNIGPSLWYQFLPLPSFECGNESVQMSPEQKIESFLRMKRTNVYSNKSSYCKERPCRQYYCPSCSNKHHSGPDQHILLPAGKPERRPRKDKNMYLVSLSN